MLLAYLGEQPLGAAARFLVRQIEWFAARMYGRGQDPNLLPSCRLGMGSMQLTAIDGGRLRVAESILPALQAAGLESLDALLAFSGGQSYRRKDGRSTLRVELQDPAGHTAPMGGKRAVFIKRHTRVPWPLRLRRLVALKPPVSQAEAEGRCILRLTNYRIPTMLWLAVGENLSGRGWTERSCLITEEISGAAETDGYCEQTFGADRSRAAVAAKRRLIHTLARIARRFHAARLVHRDFYLCHFLVRARPGEEPALFLIDLQRVTFHPRGIPRRWLVKDLGSLLFSSWPGPGTRIRSAVFTHADAMRFAHEYFGVGRLTAEHKRLVRAVIAKARRIARREVRRQGEPA
jgi:hypothetical protein